MKQTARELTNCEDGFLVGKRYLLMDRDTKFCQAFRDTLENEEIHCVQLPPRSPNLNAHQERFFGSLKSECLDRMIFFGEKALRRAVNSYVEHYYGERNHQGLDNQLIEPGSEVGAEEGKVDVASGWVVYYGTTTAKRRSDLLRRRLSDGSGLRQTRMSVDPREFSSLARPKCRLPTRRNLKSSNRFSVVRLF